MTILYRLRALVRWLFRRDEIEQALDSDLEDYIERSAAEKMRAGMSESEARRAARLELGGVEQTKERVRAMLSLGPVETLVADAGYALRTLRRQKTFAMVAVLTLALGIGASVAIFSLAEQILLRPLPVPEPDRLVNLSDPGPKTVGRMDPVWAPSAEEGAGGGPETVFSYPMFRDLEREQEPFVGVAAHHYFDPSLSTGERTRIAPGALVSGSYFPVLGLQPALGRLLGPEDDRVDGQAESVVLSYSYWQNEFGGDPDVVGQRLLVNDVLLTIVGVAPSGFHGTTVGQFHRANVFVPITISFLTDSPFAPGLAPNHERRDLFWVHLFARLSPGVTREEAAAAINPPFTGLLSEVEAPLLLEVSDPQREAFLSRSLVLEPGARGQTHSQMLFLMRMALLLLFAVSGVVLLLCCANVVGLMLLRSSARTGEMAVRASLGASRGRLASLLLAESLVLALPAAILSLPVASSIPFGLSRVPGLPEETSGLLEAVSDVSLSTTAVLVAIGIAVASALAVGLLSIRGLMRTEPSQTLQASGARHTMTRGVTRFRAALATAQVALSMALLALTGIFVQSFANTVRVDLGVDLDSITLASVTYSRLSGRRVDHPARARIVEALNAIPGVSSVASSSEPLLSPEGEGFSVSMTLVGAEAERQPVTIQAVSPTFFRMFGMELLAGRVYDEVDNDVIMVSQRFAERFGLSRDAVIGRTIEFGLGRFEIIGVVADILYGGATSEVELQAYQPTYQSNSATFYVRSAQPPEGLMNTIRETLARVDPIMQITTLRTMEQQRQENIAIDRFLAGMATALALFATGLAALGLYGVLAYSVAQRSREIGLRIALGAPSGRIRGMVMRQVTRMAVVGVVLGAIAALFLGRATQSLLFGVEGGDPLALAAAATVLVAVTLGAAYVPARRASRLDPMTVLRYE